MLKQEKKILKLLKYANSDDTDLTVRLTAIYNSGLYLPRKSREEMKKLRAYKVAEAEPEMLIWLKYFLLFVGFVVFVGGAVVFSV